MASQSSTQLVHAYRSLYRGLLHAVQYSKPARYVARDQLRNAFRRGEPATFDQQKVTRIVEFLKYAAQERGLEHQIVRSLLHTQFWDSNEGYHLRKSQKVPAQEKIMKNARVHYEMTVAMLNDSMGLCLR